MPYRDKTGPNGAGPGTGRGMGPCVNTSFTGYHGRRGMGFGYGFRAGGRVFGGRGFGRAGYGFEYPGSPMNEKDFITSEVDILEKNLDQLKKRLKEIESAPEK